MLPGSKADVLAEMKDTEIVHLSELDWQVLTPLKREFAADEIRENLWSGRAAEAGVDLETFCTVARSLNQRGVIGRFSTFLEHVKPQCRRRARHAVQRPVPLGGAARPRDRRGPRSRPVPHHDPCLLARRRA